ncbi:CRISPR-associated helicase Cas3' [Kitasatospora sp. NPDC058965]|uniref:CRISPR-associated helicase Cas3' n=1 Tax=Kitasatospora sp. NPDC058965 TaxID=3346682 RepID=UPI0036BABC7A
MMGRHEAPDETAWAKERGLDPGYPLYPLVRHLLDAAAMAWYLWDHYLSDNQQKVIADGFGLGDDPSEARSLVALCAGLHDIGKLSGFQLCTARGRQQLSVGLSRDLGRIGEQRISHDVAGMECIPAVLQALGFDAEDENELVERVAEVVGSHHGVSHRFDWAYAESPEYQKQFGGDTYARQRVAHASVVYELVGSPPQPEKFTAPAAVLITGMVVLADWLVSQEDYLRRRQRKLDASLDAHFARSLADAADLAREAGLLTVELTRKGFAESYDITGGPNPLQRSVMTELSAVVKEGRAGILLVTAAPGDGKSETALEAERVMSAACGTRGFAFLLPTMATSDQMHSRVASVLARLGGGAGGGLALTHSMAWLSAAYADEDLADNARRLVGGDERSQARGRRGPTPDQSAMRPPQWLRQGKRSLLTQFAVGTVDQALMAVLPVRHNALRLLALSGKTFIIDEAHAYDPYMQVLLGRLLNWLGAYGVPVVLLSATLPVSVSDRLIKEYLRGAGQNWEQLRKQSFRAPYPGWLYVDAKTGTRTPISDQMHEQQASERRMTLTVQVEAVRHSAGAGKSARLAVIEQLLEPLWVDGGSALVVCNTVADAQETYTWLRDRYAQQPDGGEDIQLLHARFPADVRERRTREVTEGMGRKGARPPRRIIVATQVVEQSLDLDADLVISDLAPLALLLQRAGRCWRHEGWWAAHGRPSGRDRPKWASESGPRLVVLDPLQPGGALPEQWKSVYAPFLLIETSKLLAERGEVPLEIPGDVQELVERVHGDVGDRFDWDEPAKSSVWTAYLGETLAQQGIAGAVAIPRAQGKGALDSLNALHHLGPTDELEAATRLGADSVRLLCVYQQENGTVTLDLDGNEGLPEPEGADDRIPVDRIRAVMERTIPVRAEWFRGEEDAHRRPEVWADHALLGELLVLRQPVRDGEVVPVQVRGKSLFLDDALGLVRR